MLDHSGGPQRRTAVPDRSAGARLDRRAARVRPSGLNDDGGPRLPVGTAVVRCGEDLGVAARVAGGAGVDVVQAVLLDCLGRSLGIHLAAAGQHLQ